MRDNMRAISLGTTARGQSLESAKLAATVRELAASFEPELLGGLVTLAGAAQALDDAGWEGVLYSTAAPAAQPCAIMAIPYYAWDHRAPGRMRVWVREAE